MIIALGAAAASTDNQIVNAFIFAFGIVLIGLSGTELATGNMMGSLACATKSITGWQYAGLIFYTLCGNAFGASTTAVLVFLSGRMPSATLAIVERKASMDFVELLVSGILCNICVCLSVYIAECAKDTICKIIGAYLPVVLFVAVGYEHIVANFYYLIAGTLLGLPAEIMWDFMPVIIGNLIGGGGLGVLIWYIYIYKNRRS